MQRGRLFLSVTFLAGAGFTLLWIVNSPDDDNGFEVQRRGSETRDPQRLVSPGPRVKTVAVAKKAASSDAEKASGSERELVWKEPPGAKRSGFNGGNNWENTLQDLMANLERGGSILQHPPQVPMNVDQLVRDKVFNPEGAELTAAQKRELESAIKQLNNVYVDASTKGSLTRMQALVELERAGKYEFVNREKLMKLYADGVMGNQTQKGGKHHSLLATDGGWYLFRIPDRKYPDILNEEQKQVHAARDLKRFIKDYFANLPKGRKR